MPRRAKSPTTLVVNFFMTAAVGEAKQALEIARAIVDARAVAGGSVGGNGAAPRARRGRRKEVEPPLPGMTTASSAPTAGPTAAAAPARRRRGPGRIKPPAAAVSETAPSTLPEQLAPGEE